MDESTDTERVATNVRITRGLISRIDRYAARKGLSRNAAIVVLLDKAVTEEERDER
jgi:predicted DNA binding CopG/RHH family protein